MSVDLVFTPGRVRRLRGTLTQEEFAKVVGVSKRSIIYWETGQRSPKKPMFIARLLGIEQNPNGGSIE